MQHEVRQFISSQLESRTLNRCSRYIEKVRVMGEPFPGPWSFRLFPWLLQPHDDDSEVIAIRKSCQMGFSEFAINRTIYTLDQLQRNAIYALPNFLDAGPFSRGRLNMAVERSPYLQTLFSKAKSESLKQTHAGVCLYICGANSEKTFREKAVSLVVLDETDVMSSRAIELARRRLDGQPEGKRQLLALSTPSVEGVGIDKLFEETDQHHFYFKCPHCSTFITFEFPNSFELIGESITDPRLVESYYKCTHCHKRLEHELKPEYLQTGIWVPKYPNRLFRGYHINQLFSYALKPATLAEYALRAQFDEVAKQEFYNSSLGLCYSSDGSRLTDKEINKNIEVGGGFFNDDMSRKGYSFTCLGIDIGQKKHYCVVTRWKLDPNRGRDILTASDGEVAYFGTVETFEEIEVLMQKWKPRHTVLDAQPEYSQVVTLCKKYKGVAHRCYYATSKATKEISITEEENKLSCNRTIWLDATMEKIRTCGLRFPKDIPIEFRDHLMSLVKIYKRDDKGNVFAEFVKKEKEGDHYAHACNYSMIALALCSGAGSSHVG